MFVEHHPAGNFFQSPDFFRLSDSVEEFDPFLWVAQDENANIIGTLLGVYQSNGTGLKSWLSRRLIIWGGPLVRTESPELLEEKVLEKLLAHIKKHAQKRAIYIEFRNFFDTTDLKEIFLKCGFSYNPHLNFLVKTDDEEAVNQRMSANRRRQIRKSFKAGGQIVEASSEEEVLAFYDILQQLYAEKVKKPLVGPDLFLNFWKYSLGKFFLIKYNDEVVGGAMCPIYNGRVIYDWFRCGEISVTKGLHTGILAAWASIDYGLKNGFDHMDFMGAGRPDEEYGVRKFKAPFGGELVSFGRYEIIINKTMYEIGKLGLKVYQKIK